MGVKMRRSRYLGAIPSSKPLMERNFKFQETHKEIFLLFKLALGAQLIYGRILDPIYHKFLPKAYK